MKNDEFAFFNQQLAAMVRDGIPLEAALHRLCTDMRTGKMRAELEKLEADLAKGTPLREAVRARRLPELYQQMLEVGAQSNNLPGVLTLLADHYQRRHVVWTRLKGLMVYPAIVLFASFLLSFVLSLVIGKVIGSLWVMVGDRTNGFGISVWVPPVVLGFLLVVACIVSGVPNFRRAFCWRLPAFRDAYLAQIASSLALMLKSGVTLNDALALEQQLENDTPAAADLARWRERLSSGHRKMSDVMAGSRVFPPLFGWTVSQAGEDVAAGFSRAAEAYQSRAAYRAELLLYSALPCSVLALGLVIVAQVQPVLAVFIAAMSKLGSFQ